MQSYDFGEHLANARKWECRNRAVIRKLSDWNCGRNDPRVPNAQLEAAARLAIEKLTTYTETTVTLDLGHQILASLSSLPNARFAKDAALHLYGNATQALFASLYAVRESLDEPKFLLIHPSYYATHDVLATLRIPYIPYWRKLIHNGEVGLPDLQKLWEEHRFSAILMTDPMYSTGVELAPDNFEQTVAFARDKDIWIIIDSAFSGLAWDDPSRRWLDLHKLQRCGYKKCVVIDSPSKRLFTNNLKLGMVHCSARLSPHLERFSDSFTGNITGMQYEFVKSVFELGSHLEMQDICNDNVDQIKRNYSHLLDVANESKHVHFIRPDSGFHTMIFFSGLETGSADSMGSCGRLANQGVFALPTNDYYYHDNDPFGFRINLMNAPIKWQDIVAQFAASGLQ